MEAWTIGVLVGAVLNLVVLWLVVSALRQTAEAAQYTAEAVHELRGIVQSIERQTRQIEIRGRP